ncbi:MAG: nucleotide exchange factor GrpE [Mogibacterium sp.]|nr:nucleotide exchange factor GrpE [Mogibacterium sp.]
MEENAPEAEQEAPETTVDAEEAKAKEETQAEAEAPAEEKTPEPEKESERYMRLMAEFQNYKKRVAKEKSDIRSYANEEIIGELLAVLDNFERALANDPTADAEGYAKGMELIFTQMKTVLEKAGLAEVEALGEDFDPSKHNAVMTEDSEEYDSGKVSKVLQKGYSLNKKVIRPAMVAVAN